MTEQAFAGAYLSRFSLQQCEAVTAPPGPALLLAVPGGGKTTVLLARLGYLMLCRSVPPEQILTMSYTVAATEELRARFAAQFGDALAARTEFRTINSLCTRIIDVYSHQFGKKAPFTLLEEQEAARLVSRLLQERTGEYPTPALVQEARTEIAFLKNSLASQEEIAARTGRIAELPQLYEHYCTALRQAGRMDFDDQLVYALTILKRHPALLQQFQEQYRWLCVDEAQDASRVQHALITLLAGKSRNLLLVGDEDQSIYGFRAAWPEALLRFSETWPEGRVLLLEENYRSTPEILAAAGRFIAENRSRYGKKLLPTRGSGAPVQTICVTERRMQTEYLLALARTHPEDTAVLYRNNDSALPLIDLLEREGLPYRCRGSGESFFSHRIVQDLADIAALAANPQDPEPFLRIYFKFGAPIPAAAAQAACRLSRESGEGLLQALTRCPELSAYGRDAVCYLAGQMPMLLQDRADAAVRRIRYAMRYGEYLTTQGQSEEKLWILEQLARQEADLPALLARLKALQRRIQKHQNPSAPALTLSTIHSSKGLEYGCVYLLDMLDGILPAQCAPHTEEELALYEEERRLYYVAMTRARDELCLFTCRDVSSLFTAEVCAALPRTEPDPDDAFAAFQRGVCGKRYFSRARGMGTIAAQGAGRYLILYPEGPSELLTLAELAAGRAPSAPPEQEPAAGGACSPGSRVQHRTFGPGTVRSCTGGILTVRFDRAGEKNLMLDACRREGLLQALGG